MQPFRPRWPDRSGVIVAIAGMSAGMMFCRPSGILLDGPGLVAWVVTVFAIAIPFVVLELGTGAIYQDSLSESGRKAGKPWEVVGWMAAAGALLALVLLVMIGGRLAQAAYDSLLAAIANQPSRWVANAEDTVATHGGGDVLAIAALVGVVQFRLWRGASAIARSSLLMATVACTGLVLVGGSLLLHPGAIDGLGDMLSAGPRGWSALGTPEPWLGAVIAVLVSWACGTGAVTAYGSYLNRSTDAIGIGTIAVLAGALVQVLVLMVLMIGGGVIVVDDGLTPHAVSALPLALNTVAAALANCGLPPWWSGVLQTVWFVALIALVVPAMLAMSEAVVAPLVDKFRLPRERVIPAVGLGAFFLAALLTAHPDSTQWCFFALVWVMGTTVVAQVMCSLLAVKLDAVARHLNAYSAFRLGWAWRLSVALLMPLVGIGMLVWLTCHEPALSLIGGGIAIALACGAVLVTRLHGRNG